MPLSDRQARQLRVFLRRLRAGHAIASVPGGAGKALEAWVFMVIVDAVRTMPNWHVTLRQSDSTPLPRGAAFLFSGGPSGISSALGRPCFARIERLVGVPRTLELHNGVQHIGRSGVRHEWDIAIVPSEITNAIRAGNQSYPRGLPILGIECKDKADNGSADEMRQTLARMYDLTHVSQAGQNLTHRMMDENRQVGAGRRWPVYKTNYEKGLIGILRAGGFQRGAQELSDHYHIRRFGHVSQNNHGTRDNLQRAVRDVLANIDAYF